MNANSLLRKIRGVAATVIVLAAPAVFAEDAYIESDGTTFVSTGWYMNDRARIEVDYELVDTTTPANWSYIFGAHANDTATATIGTRVAVFVSSNGSYYFVAGDDKNGNSWISPGSNLPRDSKRRIVAIDMNTKPATYSYGEKDGTIAKAQMKATSTVTSTAKYPVALFADMNNASGTAAVSTSYRQTRIYRARFWTGDTLDRDFTPCVKGGVPGFVDAVSGEFVTAANPNGLTASASAPAISDDGYVESSGNVGVNSRYFFNPKARIEVDYALTDTKPGQQRIWGMDGMAPRASFYVQGNLNIAFGCGDTFVNSDTQTGLPADTLRHTAIIDVNNKTAAFVTGVTTNWSNNAILDTHVPTTTATRPLGIFGNCTSDGGMSYSAEHFTKVKIYRIKFSTDGALVHDYVPCVQGGIAGFKDKVDGAFITSETAGDLTGGGNIMVEKGPAYIANGRQAYFDTGYTPTPHTRVEADYLHVRSFANYRVFGTYASGALYMIHYANSSTNYAWSCMDGNGNWASTGLRVHPMRRRTFILDPYTDFTGLVTAGYTNYSSTVSGPVADKGGTYNANAGATLCVCSDAGGTSVSDLRLYGFRIYESGTLVRDYIPYLKNGVVGLYDRKNGTFAGSSTATAFTIGGDFEFDQDAYLQSDSTQGINTGYLMKGAESRIECDFSFDDTSKVGNNYQQRPFGQDSGGNLLYSLYINGSGKFMFGFGNTFINSHGPGVTADTVRHTAVIDGYHNRLYWITDGVTNNTYDISGDAHNNNSTWPMGIFATPHNQAATSWRNPSKIKLYSMRIYESDKLKHEYLPYKNGDEIGLYDTVDKVVKQDARNGNAFVIGGKGVDGKEKWVKELPAKAAIRAGGSITLTAAAAGAKSYIWKKDGVEIHGETGESISVSWTKDGCKTPETYSCTAVYDVFGVETLGEPVSCEVTMSPLGMMVIIR